MLWFMGSQRVRHDCVTELDRTEPVIYKSSCQSSSSSAYKVVNVLDFDHSYRYVAVSQGCFNFHFPGDILCVAFHHMFIFHQYVILERCLLKSLAYFLIGLFSLLSLRVLCVF